MLLALLQLALIPTSHSRLVNVTIDDTYGDERTGVTPVYAPGSWLEYFDDDLDGLVQFGPEPSDYDLSSAYNQTLHCKPPETEELDDFALLESNASITFNGTAVYFYIARKAERSIEMTFYLDDALVPADMYRVSPGPYSDSVDSPGYIFDQLVFAADELTHGEHRLDFVLDGLDAHSCFDYAIYTMDDGTPSGPDSESPSPNITASVPGVSSPGVSSTAGTSAATSATAAGISHADPPRSLVIVAPLVGGVIAVIACAWFYARWRQRRRQARLEESASPLVEAAVKGKEASEFGGNV